MQVQIIVKIDGQADQTFSRQISADPQDLEEQAHALGKLVACHLTQSGLQQHLRQQPQTLRCCRRPMHSNGRRTLKATCLDGKIKLSCPRLRCDRCGHERTPLLDDLLCGPHRVTRPLARQVCLLATSEHFTQLPQRVHELLGVSLSRHQIQQLVLTVGTAANEQRRAQVRLRKERWAWELSPLPLPEPQVRPRRIYVSCDGIMYCTNQREPDPQHPGQNRLVWQQMKVGCVYWQDQREDWHKRIVWGRESPEEFGQSLYLLACECGYREAGEKVFAADGADWCWGIAERYFADAQGILDWYHASEHVHEASRSQAADEFSRRSWAREALVELKLSGGRGLLKWLEQQLAGKRGAKREAIQQLQGYVSVRMRWMDYPSYRLSGYRIGTGMMESTVKQLVEQRLKGSGMRWSEAGALAMTALRALVLNGPRCWSKFWATLALAA